MGHFTQAHGPCQAGTAFQGVQRPQQGRTWLGLLRVGTPFTQSGVQGGEQLLGLFLKNGEQVRIDHIEHVDVVIVVVLQRHRPHHGRIQLVLGLQGLGDLLREDGGSSGGGGGFHGLGQLFFQDGDVQQQAQLRLDGLLGLGQESGCKLVQQTPNFIGGRHQHGHLRPLSIGQRLQMQQHMF